MATYKSLESLKAAILKEVRSAVDAAAQESKNVLQKNVDEFYSIPEGRYHRIGMPYLFDDLRLSSFFSGIGAFECALDRLYESINKIEKRLG